MALEDDQVSRVQERLKKLEQAKQPWLIPWQRIGEFVRTRKQDFTTPVVQASFLTGKIFDSTAPNAAHLMASSLVGQLFPNSKRAFRIVPPRGMRKQAKQSKEVRRYFERVTEEICNAFDHPSAGFMLALQEYMEDQVAFGTSGIYVKESNDDDMPVTFTVVDCKVACIDDDKEGFVDTVYIKRRVSVKQLVEEYGLDRVSEESADAYNNGDLDRMVTVVNAVEPRTQGKGAFGAAGFPIASIHIEMEANKVLKNSGFYDMPIFMARFWKMAGEIYGRSPAFEAMPDIIELNIKREYTTVAEEKILNPPIAFFQDGSLGGGTLRTGAGAVNVFQVSGRMMQSDPFKQLITIGDIKPTYQRITELIEIIKRHFMLDRLLDLNNNSRMTLGEAQIRNQLRGESLSSVYSRQITEFFNRLIEHVFSVMWNRGLLGYPANDPRAKEAEDRGAEPFIIPQSILDLQDADADAYEIEFVSPAAHIIRQAELQGIQQTITFAVETSGVSPDILDNLDMDEAMRVVQELTGAPPSIMRSLEEVDEIRNQRAQSQAAQQDIATKQAQAQTAEHLGKAAQSGGKAGLPLTTLLAG